MKDCLKSIKEKVIHTVEYIQYRKALFRCRVCLWILWLMGQFDPEAMKEYHICHYKFTHREWV